jgi:hypothetical protein
VIAVEDLAGGAEATRFTVTEVFHRAGPDEALTWTGDVPVRLSRVASEAGYDLMALLGEAGAGRGFGHGEQPGWQGGTRT